MNWNKNHTLVTIIMIAFWLLVIQTLFAEPVWAGDADQCYCTCIEGKITPVCPTEAAYDLAPMCAPRVCAPPQDVRLPEPIAGPGRRNYFEQEPDTPMESGYDWKEFGRFD